MPGGLRSWTQQYANVLTNNAGSLVERNFASGVDSTHDLDQEVSRRL
jgi:hypothetical protein